MTMIRDNSSISIYTIHGAGGGAWEFDYIWKPIFESQGYHNFRSIELVPSSTGIEETQFDDYVNQIISSIDDRIPVILIGASMGGVLALKSAERVKCAGVILVCSTLPIEVKSLEDYAMKDRLYPPIVRWADGRLQDTIDAIPDADYETCKYASKLWRNESGSVLNAITAGIPCKKLSCPSLVIIPGDDNSIKPFSQLKLAEYLVSNHLTYDSMSHVGPLLGVKANCVALDVINWIQNLKIQHE